MGKHHLKMILLFVVFTFCMFVNRVMFRTENIHLLVEPHHQLVNEKFSQDVKPLHMLRKQKQKFENKTFINKTHNGLNKQNFKHYDKHERQNSSHITELLTNSDNPNSTQDINLLQNAEKLTTSHQIQYPNKSEKQNTNQHVASLQKSDKQNASLYVDKIGRFGNLLFNLAGAYGIARASDKKLVLPVNFKEEISEVFSINEFPVGNTPKDVKFVNYRYGTFEKNKAVLGNESYKVGHYIQSYRYFYNYSQELRKILTIKESLIHASQQIFKKLSNSSDVIYIGIHIRRGDLERQGKIDYGYRMAKPSFIYHAMNYYLDLLKNKTVYFIICSDSLKWAKTHISSNKSNIYFSSSGSAITDFVLLTQCNHSIITVGTFGWWSAWIAGGKVIYYSDPVTPGSPLDNDFTAKDYFWPSWIGMNDTGYIT